MARDNIELAAYGGCLVVLESEHPVDLVLDRLDACLHALKLLAVIVSLGSHLERHVLGDHVKVLESTGSRSETK